MTSFAGSIGIIGIALILSVSTGVNAYINQVQEDTLSSYPLTINAESDMVSLLANFMGQQAEDAAESKDDGFVYSRDVMFDMMSKVSSDATGDGVTLNDDNFGLVGHSNQIKHLIMGADTALSNVVDGRHRLNTSNERIPVMHASIVQPKKLAGSIG